MLGRALAERDWAVRGTTRDAERLGAIEADGIEAVIADPNVIGTVLDRIDGVALIYWLFAAASGEREDVVALHTSRLERLLEEIVDTPVRGFVYEMATHLEPAEAARTFEALRHAGETWRIPFEVVDAGPEDHDLWLEGMLAAGEELIG